MHIYDLISPRLHETRAGKDVFQLCLREDKANMKKMPPALDCSVKKDGLFIMAHQGTLFARSGQSITNQALLNIPDNIQQLMRQHPTYAFQFELKPTKLRNTVFNGAISPVRTKPVEIETARELRFNEFWLTDAMRSDVFLGHKQTRRERRLQMNYFEREYNLLVPKWEQCSHAEMLVWAKTLIEQENEEGLVGYNPYGCYEPGARRVDLSIKKAKELRLDLRCVGVRPGKNGKRIGMAEGLDIQYGSKVIKVDFGEGWTDEKRIEVLNNPKEAVGHVFEVYAFDQSELGILRQPKVGQRRDDKTIPDEVE